MSSEVEKLVEEYRQGESEFMRRLQRAGSGAALQAALDDMRQSGHSAPTLWHLNAAVSRAGHLRSWPVALRIFRSIGPPNGVGASGAAVAAAAAAGKGAGEAPSSPSANSSSPPNYGLKPNVVSYTALLRAWARGRRGGRAKNRRLWLKHAPSTLASPPLEPSSALSAASASSASAAAASAPAPGGRYGKNPDVPLLVLDEMRSVGVAPDVRCYTAAIHALATQDRNWRGGLSLLREMRWDAGLRPNVITLTAAMLGCERAGEWEQCWALLQDMRRGVYELGDPRPATPAAAAAPAASNDDHDDGKASTSSSAAAAAAAAAAAGGSSDGSDRTTTTMPNVHSYNTALRACLSADELDAVDAIAASMSDPAGTHPAHSTVPPNAATKKIIALAAEKRGAKKKVTKDGRRYE